MTFSSLLRSPLLRSPLLRALAPAAALMLAAAPAFAQSPTRTRLITASPSPAGQPTTLTAEVDALGGGAPRGDVSFADGATSLGSAPLNALGAGQATLAMGRRHNCALSSDGGVKCWGRNFYGGLGDGTQNDRWTPVPVVGLTTGVVAVTAGGGHSCAIVGLGAVECWGANDAGQLGDGTNLPKTAPVAVLGLKSGVVAVTAGDSHTCALTASGAVECWGAFGRGQLGIDSVRSGSSAKYTPHAVNDATLYTDVVAGRDHTCGLTSVGGVRCWGKNDRGQVGIGFRFDVFSPDSVYGLRSGVVAVTAGGSHSCAVTSAGAIKCWGANDRGQLGDGTVIDRVLPVQVHGLEGGVVAVEAGDAHTCALLNTGAVYCWGDNSSGQLGDRSAGHSEPSRVVDLGGFAVSLGSGAAHSCALLSPSRIMRCWGANQYGQIGDGTNTPRLLPTTAKFSGVVRARAQRAAIPGPGWRFLEAHYPRSSSHAASSTFIPHRAQ